MLLRRYFASLFLLLSLLVPEAALATPAASATVSSVANILPLSSVGAIASAKRKGALGGGGSIPYNTQFGVTNATTGWIDFPLNGASRRVWIKPAANGGSDANDCLSFANACATFVRGFGVWSNPANQHGGDQLMIGGPGTYTDDGSFVDGSRGLASGISLTYPNMVLSYDVADPTNTAKYGKIVGTGRPKLIIPNGGSAFSMPGCTGSANFGVQGLDLDAQGLPERVINISCYHPGIVFQNDRFIGVRLVLGLGSGFVDGTEIYTGPALVSKSSGFGAWSVTSNFSFIDAAATEGYHEQEVIGGHAGWAFGVNRDEPIATGGPSIFGHGRYWSAQNHMGKSDFTVWFDNAVDGDNTRGPMTMNYSVHIMEPTVGTTGGFSNCICENPNGVTIQRNTGLVVGGADLATDSFRGGAWGMQNTLSGSFINNYLLVANPLKGTTPSHGVSFVGPCSATGMIDAYLLMQNITGYGYSDVTNGDGSTGCNESLPGKIHITWANSKLDQLAPGTGNSVSSAGDFTSPWTSTSNLATAMGASSIEDLYNKMLSRPDLPWARSMVTAAFTAHNKSQPLSGVPPPSAFTPDLTPYVVDNTAPTLSLPVGTQTGNTTATVGATTNENNGRLFDVVTTSATAPAAHFVIRGLDATGQPVGGGGSTAFYASSQAITSTGAKTLSATGLASCTSYYSHAVHEDARGNVSNVVSSGQFTTTGCVAGGTTWDIANSGTLYTFSNGNLTAAHSAVGTQTTAIGTTGHSGAATGDWWFDLTPTGGQGATAGLATGPVADGQNLFSTSSLIQWWSAGDVYSGGTDLGTVAGFNTSVGTIRFRLKNGKLYLATVSGGVPTWVLGDPVAQTGGIDLSARGTLYPAVNTGAAETFAADFTNW